MRLPMPGRRIRSLALAALALMALWAVPRPSLAQAPAPSAAGAILVEGVTGRVLYESNADARLPMASTTKIMTALLALENASPDDLITVADEACGAEGSSMYLFRGERISMRDLLYGLMLTSGNDAAVAIACAVGGSVESFADMMNARAASLGCSNTNFVTPNGLHDQNHYTSARDLAAIACEAMKNPAFREIVSTDYHETSTGDKLRVLKNKNRLLWEYQGGCGIKTGYTKAAGRCLAFSAQREDTLLIGVVLSCYQMWDAAQALLNYGFSLVETRLLASAERSVGTVPVEKGAKRALEVCLKHDILYPVRQDGSDVIDWMLETQPPLAPVHRGDPVGRLTLMINGEAVVSAEIVACEDVAAADWKYYIGQAVGGFLS